MNTRKLESITLEQFIKLGDRVIVSIDPEKRHWIKVKHEDGTIGEVVGFKQYDNYVCRVHNFGTKPGIYSQRGMPLVRFADRTGDYFSASDIAFEDPTLYEQRKRERTARGGLDTDDEYSNTTRIGDLPETPFWEGDIVTVHSEHWGGNFGAPCVECETPAVLKVDSINYSDRHGEHTYSVSGKYATGHTTGQIRAGKEELKLVERGNLWRHYNSEPLVFADIQEEILFNMQLHKVHEVKNPLRNDWYLWTRAEALTAIREGRADGFNVSQGFFGSGPSIRVQRFDDRDLGERVRAETIAGWATTPENEPDPENDALVESKMERRDSLLKTILETK